MPRRGENIRKRKDGRWEGRYIKGYDSKNQKAKYACFIDCEDDIYTTAFIYPTILGRQAHAIKQYTVQHLGISRDVPKSLARE